MAEKKKAAPKPPASSGLIDLAEARRLRDESLARARAEGVQVQAKPGGAAVTLNFILECVDTNELGDSLLYGAIHGGRFLFVRTSPEGGDWHVWDGHHWRFDKLVESQRAVEDVALAYLSAAGRFSDIMAFYLGDEKRAGQVIGKLRTRANALRKEAKQRTILSMVTTNVPELVADAERMDADPWLLGVANGVLDLKTGELRDGRQADLISKCARIGYQGPDAPREPWEKSLAEMYEQDPDTVAALKRLMGYSLVGERTDHKFAVLYGAGGRNGKGTIFGVLEDILGDGSRPSDLMAPIQAEMLLDPGRGRGRSADAPSPAIMNLKGKRIVYAEETKEGDAFDAGRIKWLSGNSTLTGRHLQDRHPTSFRPSHLLYLLTNDLPEAPGHDTAFWDRALLFNHKFRFVEEPKRPNERKQDPMRKKELETCLPGILAWMVEGCLEWQALGLCPSQSMRGDKETYQKNEDVIGQFLDAACELSPDAEATAEDLYFAFEAWFLANVGRKVWSQKAFGRTLRKIPGIQGSKSGTVSYVGITLTLDGQDLASKTRDKRDAEEERHRAKGGGSA